KATATDSNRVREAAIEVSLQDQLPGGTAFWSADLLMIGRTQTTYKAAVGWPLNRHDLITGNMAADSGHGRLIQSSLRENERPRKRDGDCGYAIKSESYYRRGCTFGCCRGPI